MIYAEKTVPKPKEPFSLNIRILIYFIITGFARKFLLLLDLA